MSQLLIAGKRVNVLFGEIIPIKKSAEFIRFMEQNSNHKIAVDLLDAYRRNNQPKFNNICKEIILDQVIKVLKHNPEFITGNPFEIHIRILFSRNSEYYWHISGPNIACLAFNPFYGVRFNHFDMDLSRRIGHEFVHHLDNPLIRRFRVILGKLIDRAEVNKEISINSALLVCCLSEARSEAPAVTYDLNSLGGDYSAMPFDFSHFFSFVKGLSEIANASQEMGPKIYDNLSRKFAFHHVGSMMAGIILAAELKRKNREKYIVLAKRNLASKVTDAIGFSQLPKMFGRENFVLGFKIDKKQFLTFVRSKIMTLERIAFLKKYEESCHYLGIKEPIMTLARYNQFKLQAYKNFQKLKAAKGFK